MAFAAAPASDMTKEAEGVADTKQPTWWADLRATLHDPILSRVTRLSVADPMVMPLTVARDVGAAEPEVYDAATAAIVPELSSPLADRFATWGKHVTLIATLGRSYWVRLYPDDIPSVPGWPTAEQRGGWVVVSPFNHQPVGGSMAELVLDGGHRVTVARSRLVVCQRSGRVLSGEPYSELRTLAEQAQLSDRVVAALWSRTDTSAQGAKVLSIEGGDRAPQQSQGSTSDPKSRTIVEAVMATLAKRLQAIVQIRKDPKARAPMVVAGRGDKPLDVADMTVNTDGGLIATGTWSDQRIAIGAGVPTAQLTGESPKYANMFADRLQFARSESGILAREVAAAALPLLAAITSEGRFAQYAGSIWWLDPTPLIEEAQEDAAAARGTMAAAPAGMLAEVSPAERINTIVDRAERRLFADAEMLALVAPADRDGAADRLALSAIDALNELRETLDAPLSDVAVRVVRRAALGALDDSLDELKAEAIAAAIGLPTIVRRIVERVKEAVFGRSASPTPDGATGPILDRVGISPYLTAEFGDDVPMVWVYGLPSTRENPYEPHYANDGAEGTKPGDFAGEEPDGSPCFPGGHNGCQCYLRLKVT